MSDDEYDDFESFSEDIPDHEISSNSFRNEIKFKVVCSDTEDLQKILVAIKSPISRDILIKINESKEGLIAAEIAKAVNQPQNNVTPHIKKLRQFGHIKGIKRKRKLKGVDFTYYIPSYLGIFYLPFMTEDVAKHDKRLKKIFKNSLVFSFILFFSVFSTFILHWNNTRGPQTVEQSSAWNPSFELLLIIIIPVIIFNFYLFFIRKKISCTKIP